MAHFENGKFERTVYRQIFDAVPIGLFLVGPDHSIYAWNAWMVRNTSIEHKKAIGKQFKSLFPNTNLRFEWALEQVLEYNNPQVISSILNKFVIPISFGKKSYLNTEMMQQNVEILPIIFEDKNMALVVIQDVSDKVNLKNTLLSLANKFEKHSLIDPLTGTYNRSFLWQHLEEELQTAQHQRHNVVCCMFDIDYFKKINDDFGHDAGDDVLISFVNICQSQLRATDLFFRYGGEEFVVIFTALSIESAITLATRIRNNVAAVTSHGKVNKRITCSGGIAYWQPSIALKSPEQLVKEADIQLYQAKKFGRNCIFLDNSPK